MTTASTAPNQQVGTTPPYISYLTLKNLLGQLRENGQLPNKVDRTVLKKFSGSQQKALLSALRFLGLTDGDDRRTELFSKLHAAKGADEKPILKGILERHYPATVKELAGGSAETLRDAFDVDFPNSSDTTKKSCLAFFIAAAKDTGFTISPYVLAKAAPRKTRKGNGTDRSVKKTETQPKGGRVIPPEADHMDDGLVTVPIPMGLLKTWQIRVGDKISQAEADHFAEIVTRTLKLMVDSSVGIKTGLEGLHPNQP